MSENRKRILFLCAHRSVREIMAASLLAAYAHEEWDIWIAPGTFAGEFLVLFVTCRSDRAKANGTFVSPITAPPHF